MDYPKQLITSENFCLVTSATPEYLPGLVALRNSIEVNFPDAQLYCFYYDKGTNLELPERINYIHNAPMLGPVLDETGLFRNGLLLGPDMYSRLLIPLYFTGKVLYIDADCLILDNLSELWALDLGDSPTACVYRPDIGWVGGHIYDDMASGVYFCDTERWRELKLTENCFHVMKQSIDKKLTRKFKVNVESVLSYVHGGVFLRLPATYQNLTYYGELIQEDKIAHFAGPKPWKINRTHKIEKERSNYQKLWNAYHSKNIFEIRQEHSKLPLIRGPDPWKRQK